MGWTNLRRQQAHGPSRRIKQCPPWLPSAVRCGAFDAMLSLQALGVDCRCWRAWRRSGLPTGTRRYLRELAARFST